MNRVNTCFLILFLVSNSLLGQDTITTYFDKDWNQIQNKELSVYYRKAFLDNNKAWSVHDFYASHQLQMIGTYKTKKADIKQGHFVYYYENGQKQSEGEYINDKKEGMWIGWYENGQQKSKGNYLNEKLNGIWEYWHENGEKKAKGNFMNDYKTGTWSYWYENGQIKIEEEHKSKSMYIYKGYAINGKFLAEGCYINNVKQGIWNYYNIEGRLILKGEYKNGLQEGEWIRYFKNGSMNIVFKNGNYLSKKYGGIIPNE